MWYSTMALHHMQHVHETFAATLMSVQRMLHVCAQDCCAVQEQVQAALRQADAGAKSKDMQG